MARHIETLLCSAALAGCCLLGHAASSRAETGSPVQTAAREQLFAVTEGRDSRIIVRVCRPSTDTPARLVVINHGSPVNPADRVRVQPGRCGLEAAQWFLTRGYVVAFPLRRGYGASGGSWAEDYGGCSQPDYFHAGLETARDIDAAVDAVTGLPFVLPTGVVIVGQSAGGWGTIAYDSVAHPKVAAFIVMAGGRGGHAHGQPNRNCQPYSLVQTAGRFGSTATTPMLWVYAKNDTFFGPAIAQALYRSFTARGGKTEFEQPERFGGDGHQLFFGRGGSIIWGPLVERYLAQRLPGGN